MAPNASPKRKTRTELMKNAKVKELSAEQATKRSGIVMWWSPFTTLALFIQVAIKSLIDLTVSGVAHPFTRFVLVPLLAAFGWLWYIENEFVDEILFAGWFALWWFGLGVLSSVGLGSGMHSGILFLFPHIFKVVNAAKQCQDMNYDSHSDMWWQACSMKCESTNPAGAEDAPFMAVLLRVLVPAMLWGAGTACGEIPPYAVSRAAALAGEDDEETSEAMAEMQGDDAMSKMKAWMAGFVEKYGFWGVLIMSSWPNAAFDLVGIVCGQLGVPFWTFLSATMIGKAGVKVNGQAVFFVWWFRNPELFINLLHDLVERLPGGMGESIDVRAKLTAALAAVTGGVEAEEEAEQSWPKFLGESLILVVILSFVVSTVNQFAQGLQKERDLEALYALDENKKETKKTK